jgi:hypothetical protein
VPACNPLLRQPPPNDLPACPTSKPEEPADASQRGTTSRPPRHLGTGASDTTPAAGSEILVDKVGYPALTSGSELIPEPHRPEKLAAAVRPFPPPEREPGESHPDLKTKPPEDPPLVQAMRFFLDKQPAEAIALLERYDKPSQDLLISLLPLAVRLTEKDWQRNDPREVGVVLDQLDRLAAPLHRRAPLRIKQMCLCSRVEGFGKYQPLPESYGFKPGDLVQLYVELQNLTDERQGKDYGFHLLTNIAIIDFKGKSIWHYKFDDPGPNFSLSERHDFFHLCFFHIPIDKPRIASGLYTLYVKITDVATGREIERTLDFRVRPAYGQNGW